MESERLITVSMIRAHLRDIPQYSLPAGYCIRQYQPGDETVWLQILRQSERCLSITPKTHQRAFARNESALRDRQLFLCADNGEAVGTATAWFDPQYHGRRFGRVHWMAILPRLQGQGLAKPLLTAVCNRLLELVHDCAYLRTETVRIPAIGLYLKFGFAPEINNDQDRSAWATVKALGLPIQV